MMRLFCYRKGFVKEVSSAVTKKVCPIHGPVMGAMLILLAVSTGVAAGPSDNSIEKARELVMSGERMKALRLLRDAHREASKEINGKSNKKRQREIAKAWEEIGFLFLSDRGQSQFSLAESVWFLRPKEAADILGAIGKSENGNVAIALLGGRSALRARDCALAQSFSEQADAGLPMHPEVRLLKLQVQDCINGTNAAAPALKTAAAGEGAEGAATPVIESAYRLLVVRDAVRRKDLRSARAALTAWETQATDDPEMWYWKWMLSAPEGRDHSAARRYLRICAELTPRKRKNYFVHPELCSQTETVESELKASEKKGS